MTCECTDCGLLLETAIGAILSHMKLAANMDIAALLRNQEGIAKLKPILEEAYKARESAIADYKAHLYTHGSDRSNGAG